MKKEIIDLISIVVYFLLTQKKSSYPKKKWALNVHKNVYVWFGITNSWRFNLNRKTVWDDESLVFELTILHCKSHFLFSNSTLLSYYLIHKKVVLPIFFSIKLHGGHGFADFLFVDLIFSWSIWCCLECKPDNTCFPASINLCNDAIK